MAAILIEIITEPENTIYLPGNIREDLLGEHMRLKNIEREAIKLVTGNEQNTEKLQNELLQLTAFRYRRNIPPAFI